MRFLAATEQGKNAFWRYAVGIVTILFFWLLLGAIPVAGALLWVQIDGNPETTFNPETGLLAGVGPIWPFLVPNLTFPIFLLGIFIVVRIVHERRLRSLVTPAPRVNWRRVALGFALWFLLAAAASGIEILAYPGEFVWSGVQPGLYLLFAVLALIVTPVQTSTEELFFRGYLLQATGRLTGDRTLIRRLGAVIINGLLFAAPHALNPEVSEGPVLLMLYYFGMGAFLAWVTLRDGTAELALGAHAANNLFVALLVNFEDSALQTPALLMTDRFDPVYNLATFLISAVIFAVLAFGVFRRREQDTATATMEADPG